MGDSSTCSGMSNSDLGDNAYNNSDTANSNTGDGACNSLGGSAGSSDPQTALAHALLAHFHCQPGG